MTDPPAASSSESKPPASSAAVSPETQPASEQSHTRRGWLSRAAAGGLGALALLVPAGIGALFALDPIVRKGSRDGEGSLGRFRRVAPLDAVVPGAPPRTFPVIADREDAWEFTPNVEVGSVLLFREAGSDGDGDDDAEVLAWSTVCPHLGCHIDWQPDRDAFFCPCHASLFAEDGSRQNQKSPRDMDRLETEIRDGEVWVAYVEYKTGTAEQIPV